MEADVVDPALLDDELLLEPLDELESLVLDDAAGATELPPERESVR